MSKVTHINSGDYYALDCGHVLNDFDVEGAPKKDAEVDCPVCADNEERVKAARLEEAKEIYSLVETIWESGANSGWPILEAIETRIIELEPE